MKTRILLYIEIVFILIFIVARSSFPQMVWNQACKFEGTNSSYISMPHSTALDITGAFTLEAYINPDNSTSPANQIILQKREGIHNSGYTLFLRSGKVAIRINQQLVLSGKTLIPSNQWTQVVGTFNGSVFYIFINGALDTSRSFALPPASNTDSTFIGKGFDSPFKGYMDEVRIWNTSYNGAFRNISLSTNIGIYNSLKLSLTFQNLNPSGTLFSVNDFSGNNNVFNRGVTGLDLSDSPNGMFSLNECYHAFSNYNYVRGIDHPNVSPVSGITIEAWIWPESYNSNPSVLSTVVHKGTPSLSRKDYCVLLNLNHFEFYINEIKVAGITGPGELFPLRRWSHFGVTYSGSDGIVCFVRNGKLELTDTNFVGNIHDNSDSLFVAGTSAAEGYSGYLDELRITSAALSSGTIINNMFTSINESNDGTNANVIYNFDGSTSSNTDAGPVLISNINYGQFSHNAYFGGLVPISPLTNSVSTNFPDGYYMRSPFLKIPETGNFGFMNSDTLDVALNETISDVNVFVGLNHSDEDDLIISLISPTGISTTLYSTSSLIAPSDHIITIFDDQADSSLGSNRYIAYTPTIKPLNNLNSSLIGQSTNGKWKLKIQDAGVPDSGMLIGWGIQFNDQITRSIVLSLSALIQGFYDSSLDMMVKDTVSVYLRNSFAPYAVVDSSKAKLDSSGTGSFLFQNAADGVNYFLQVRHRNSIETWSASPESFTSSSLIYDFTNSSVEAYGSNMIQVDISPVRFAVYNGDPNQDGTVDASDIVDVYNDALLATSGYVVTDINGDDFVDASDIILTYNNAINIIYAITP